MRECQVKGKEVKVEEFPVAVMDEPNFVNSLRQSVVRWQQLITVLQQTSDSAAFDSVLDEVNFYTSFLNTLNSVDKQINSPETDLTKQLLNIKKKYHIVIGFDNDINFSAWYNNVRAIADFMRSFPINELLSSTQFGEICNAIDKFTTPIEHLCRLMHYPIKKCVNLFEALARDLKKHLLGVLKEHQIMKMDLKDFKLIYEYSKTAFTKWDLLHRSFREHMKSQRYDRNNKLNMEIKAELLGLKDRIHKVFEFRDQHSSLREIFSSIISKEKQSLDKTNIGNFIKIEDIDRAYSYILQVDILDLSPEGDAAFESAKNRYEGDIDSVEKTIINKIRERLGSSDNSSEMYRVWIKFSTLLKRPGVKNALFEYQESMLNSFMEDMKQLKSKFKRRYDKSGSSTIAKFYDVPDLTGNYLWCEEINRKLEQNIKKVEYVMGNDFIRSGNQKGKEIQELQTIFQKSIGDSKGMVEKFKNEYENYQFTNHLIFMVRNKKASTDSQLDVNFDFATIEKVKDMRNLLKLKHEVFFKFSIRFNFAKTIWPAFLTAACLRESLQLYNELHEKIDNRIEKLLSHQITNLQKIIKNEGKIKWCEDKPLSKFIKDFTKGVNEMEDTVHY